MDRSTTVEKLSKYIAGEIALSENPGEAMKKWRDLFGVSQTQLAAQIGVSPSMISDYESGRRKHPGSSTIKKFVEALIGLDENKGFRVVRSFAKIFVESPPGVVLETCRLKNPVTGRDVVKTVAGEVVTNEELLTGGIHGYMVVDTNRLLLLGSEEVNLVLAGSKGWALILTNVENPGPVLAVVRVLGVQPGLVVLQSLSDLSLDELSIKMSELGGFPLVVSKHVGVEKMLKALRRLL